jgi:hypothetical protein
MNEKEAYISKLKAQLERWDAEIDVFEAKANLVKAETKVEYQEQIKE